MLSLYIFTFQIDTRHRDLKDYIISVFKVDCIVDEAIARMDELGHR